MEEEKTVQLKTALNLPTLLQLRPEQVQQQHKTQVNRTQTLLTTIKISKHLG